MTLRDLMDEHGDLHMDVVPPGSTVLIQLHEHLPCEQIERIAQQLKGILAPARITCVVVQSGMTTAIGEAALDALGFAEIGEMALFEAARAVRNGPSAQDGAALLRKQFRLLPKRDRA